jgi:spastin
MRTLFAVARKRQPCFIWVDEIDSILGSRGDGEHEASRRLKTEFLVQFDGASSAQNDAVYVMAATNRPQDLDSAVLRRLDKRIYVPLPNAADRLELLHKLSLGSRDTSLTWAVTMDDLKSVAASTRNLSGADLRALCREAALMPLRELGSHIAVVEARNVRPVSVRDMRAARATVKPAASRRQIAELEAWDLEFGTTNRGGTSRGCTSGNSRSRGMHPAKVRTKRWGV